jgi:hypothetical protein
MMPGGIGIENGDCDVSRDGCRMNGRHVTVDIPCGMTLIAVARVVRGADHRELRSRAVGLHLRSWAEGEENADCHQQTQKSPSATPKIGAAYEFFHAFHVIHRPTRPIELVLRSAM